MTDRHQFRADWHDYNEGIYFVTICCAEKKHFFGYINDSRMQLSEIGKIMQATLENMAHHFPDVEIWNRIIMPNHIHIVIAVGTRHGASASSSTPASVETAPQKRNFGCLKPKRHVAQESQDFHHNSRLAIIIGQIKSTVKREANKRCITFNWQPRYHDHIIRNQRAFENIMNYIDANVDNWCYDSFNSDHIDNANAPWNIKIKCTESNADAPWRVPTNTNDYES